VIGQPKGVLASSLLRKISLQERERPESLYRPQFEGVEHITFPTFVMGVPITNETQVNNTFYVSDGFSRVLGAHTFKVGVQFNEDQVNEHPNATFNGTFNINAPRPAPLMPISVSFGSGWRESLRQPLGRRWRSPELARTGQDWPIFQHHVNKMQVHPVVEESMASRCPSPARNTGSDGAGGGT
jgi:hypothetical protein